MQRNFTVRNHMVLLEIPESCWWKQGINKDLPIKLDKPDLKGVEFEVIEVGHLVEDLKVGDKCRFDDMETVGSVQIKNKFYLFLQEFDINIRLKRSDELNVVQGQPNPTDN